MSKPITCGVIVPIKVKPEHAAAMEEFLVKEAVPAAKGEPGTIHWFGAKIDGMDNAYAVFDTFVDSAAHEDHMKGRVAAGLMSKGDWLAAPLSVKVFDVLAAKSAPQQEFSDNKGGVTVGLRVYVEAKPDKVEEVQKFLIGALPLAEAEPATTYWAVIRVRDTNTFGILDSFPDEAGRQAHLNGKIAEALFANVDRLLVGPPEVLKTTIVAANIN